MIKDINGQLPFAPTSLIWPYLKRNLSLRRQNWLVDFSVVRHPFNKVNYWNMHRKDAVNWKLRFQFIVRTFNKHETFWIGKNRSINVKIYLIMVDCRNHVFCLLVFIVRVSCTGEHLGSCISHCYIQQRNSALLARNLRLAETLIFSRMKIIFKAKKAPWKGHNQLIYS